MSQYLGLAGESPLLDGPGVTDFFLRNPHPEKITLNINTLVLLSQGEAEAAFVGICFLLFMCGSVLVSIASLVFFIWMVIDCAQNEPKMEDNQTLMWILVILLLGIIGAAIYYFVRRPNNRAATYFPPGNPMK